MLRYWNLLLCLGLLLTACGDDASSTDGDVGQGDGGTPDGAVAARCNSDAECDNDLFCDGQEVCVEGACLPGLPVRCDDGIDCTIDRCSEMLRACESAPPDQDGDGHFDASCLDEEGEPFGDDCDDTDPLRFPGNIEICDDRDDDCDPDTTGEKDTDGDGFVDALCCNDGNCGDDCDDLKPSVNPMATEACDLFDNDCDGEVDEGVSVDMYPDADRDGHGALGSAVKRCPGAVGFALEQDDCDDDDPEVFEGQFEICDQKDNDCDTKVDEIRQDAPWFLDVDQDGFGDPTSTPIFSCDRLPGRVLSNNDCRDDDPAIHPAAAELCDGVDNDCNGLKDFNLGVNDFEDDDDDGLADTGCGAGAPDCNDRDGSTGAGLDEICDRVDNDCDDKIDEQTAQTVWYLDMDGDGWGVDRGTALARCEPIPGRASNLGDCRDDVNAIHPGAAESCNGVDQDCDGIVDESTDHLCALPNAIAGCRFGACDVLACFPGFADVDDADANGCESSVPLTPTGDACPTGTDAECSELDGDYCNGREVCISGQCYFGTPAVCSGPTVLQGSHQIVNSFHIQQLANIETITGDLTISGTNALQTLAGLSNLKVIGGRLLIDGAVNLKSINGLSGLTTVGGEIIIVNNPHLQNIDLPALASAGSIFIEDNDALATVGGYGQLVTVHGDVTIRANPNLTSIPGFGALRSLRNLTIFQNGMLASMTGFGSLDHVRMNLDIHENAHTAIAFAKLRRVDGDLNLDGVDFDSGFAPNYTTTSVSLPELDYVGSNLFIRDLWNLASLNLNKLRHVGAHLSLALLDALTSLSLPELTFAGGFEVASNSQLTSLSVPKLKDVATDMVGANPYGIADGDLAVRGNAITALSFPELLTVDGEFNVSPSLYGNDTTLTSISAPKLHTIGGALYIAYFDALMSLTMNALTSVGEYLTVDSCAALTTLQMQALGTIGSDLYLSYNSLLPTLADFGLRDQSDVLQLQVLGSYLYIHSNTTLCSPEVSAFVAAVVTNGYAGNTPYTVGNNDGCQ